MAKKKTAAAKVEPERVRLVAHLDHDGVLIKFEELPLSKYVKFEETAQRIKLDVEACDLTPGGYKWDAAERTFVPLQRLQQIETQLDRDILRAEAEIETIKWLEDIGAKVGKPLPKVVRTHRDQVVADLERVRAMRKVI